MYKEIYYKLFVLSLIHIWDDEEKETKGHEGAEDLVAAKWKSRIIVRYATGAERSPNIKTIQTTHTPNMSDYG